MPDYESLSTIGKKDKSSKQDDLANYLNAFDLKIAQEEVKDIRYSEEAELFINVIISSYRLCDRISKESNDSITVEKGLCNGCHFNAPEKVCNKVIHPLSVRVKEDLYRYGKALAWYLGDTEVQPNHIKVLAPYMIWHRSSLSKSFKNELKEGRFESGIFSLNIELDSTKELIDKISFEFEGLLPLLKKFEKVKKGKLLIEEFQEFVKTIKQSNNNFLITIKEIVPILEQEYVPVYNEIIGYNKKIEASRNLVDLGKLKQELSDRYDIPNRQFLADLIEKERRKIGSQSFSEIKFKISFDNFIEFVSKECFDLYKLVNSRFNSDFNPSIRRVEVLSDISESEFNLTMEKVSEGGGNYSLRFLYRGNHDNPIYNFLKLNSVG
jgi:predicted  nucleic acid-binding Zn-ribbon protein